MFNEIGGMSFKPAIFPTIKFPDQNRAANQMSKKHFYNFLMALELVENQVV